MRINGGGYTCNRQQNNAKNACLAIRGEFKMVCKIFCDSRELRSGVPAHLERLGAELHIEIMEVGDYVVSERVGFERKATEDFLKSWIEDKKLFTQLHDLKKSYEIPILLIEGIQDDLYTLRRVDFRAVQGCINAIALMGIPTLYTLNQAETAQVIFMIAKKEQEENKKPFQFHGKRSHMTKNEQLEYVVSSIPGIGRQTAIDLLTYFGSIENIAKAGISELQEVKNIGEKTTIAIRNIVTENYNRS